MNNQESFNQSPLQNQAPSNFYPPYSNLPKPPFEMQKSDFVFAFLAIFASVITTVIGIFDGFALGYMLSTVFMTLLFFVYSLNRGKVGLFSVLCTVLSLACSSSFIITGNGTVRFCAVVLCFWLLLTSFDSNTGDRVRGNFGTLAVFYRAGCSLTNIDITLKALFSSSDGNKKSVGKALIGIACSIPALIIIVPLLINSDDAFKGMMSKIFGNSIAALAKITLGILASIFVISYGFSVKKSRTDSPAKKEFNIIENIYVISFLSAICVCYLLYLFSQLAYFFGAFSGFLPQNYSYADYARKGFFEMCIIAIINLCLVLLTLLFANHKGGIIKAITTFISAFTLLIIATALSKMVLYISNYGMTVLRIGTSAFMLFLTVLFVAVILKIYLAKINVVKTALLSAGVIVFILGAVNINSVCAEYNYSRFITGKTHSIDVEAYTSLGDEGIPYLTKLACVKNADIANEAKGYLAEAYVYKYFDCRENVTDFTVKSLKKHQKSSGFAGYSIPKQRAYDALYELAENNEDFGEWCYDYFYADKYEATEMW